MTGEENHYASSAALPEPLTLTPSASSAPFASASATLSPMSEISASSVDLLPTTEPAPQASIDDDSSMAVESVNVAMDRLPTETNEGPIAADSNQTTTPDALDDPLEQKVEYQPNDLIWVKIKGFPWWPAKVVVQRLIEEWCRFVGWDLLNSQIN